MNQACVSLEEVFAAAGARVASLVPETSGYLALAVADATSRLPYAMDDRAVLLTADGNVMVPRKGPMTAPPEAARVLRELLRRLLGTSTGSMPGLASAARARAEEVDVDRVVSDIEAALIPVNRAAAKRALARLSRETLRAKETGKLKKKSLPAPPPPPPERSAAPAAQPVIAAPVAPAAQPVIAAPVAPPAQPKVIVSPELMAAPKVAVDLPVAAAPKVAVEPPVLVAAAVVLPPAPVVLPPAPVVAAPPPMVVLPPAPVMLPPAPVVAEPALSPAPAAAVKEPDFVVKAPDFVAQELALVAQQLEAGGAESAIQEPVTTTPTPIEVDFSPLPQGDCASSGEGIVWNEEDATIADPEAMAVIEAAYREAETAPAADVEMNSASAHEASKAASSLARELLAADPMEQATPGELTAEAPQTAFFSTPEMSRADELLHAFHPENQGDPALLAAASSLRQFAGIDDVASSRAQARTPASERATYMARRPATAYHDSDDGELPIPAPRVREQARSRWPLALFALGVLVLFAAWLYRPTLAHDFFGLRQLVAPAPVPAALPPSTADVAPEPAPPAQPVRSRETRAEGTGSDGARRRRD